MNKIYATTTLVLVCGALSQSCSTSPRTMPIRDFHPPTPREQCGVTTNTERQVRVGYLAATPMQHPSFSGYQDYLDLHDAQGNWINQIVMVFDDAVTPPHDRSRPIEITGQVGHIDMGGPPGTKGEYANDVVFVGSWRYLSPEVAPRKEIAEPSL